MTESVAIAVVLGAALTVRLSISLIMKRLSVTPEDEAARSAGIGDVLRRLTDRRRARG